MMQRTVHRTTRPLLAALVAVGVTLSACEEGPPPDAVPVGDLPAERRLPAPPPKPVCDPDAPLDPGLAMPRRLTRLEYANTVRDLLGLEVAEGVHFPPEEQILGFDNNARSLQITPLHAEGYLSSAEDLATRYIEAMDDWLPCDRAQLRVDGLAAQRDCAEGVIADLGRRAWRRPLTEAEHGRLLALYDVGAELEGPAFENGLTMVVEALLQSPNFLFRVEVGAPDPERPGLNRLDDHELASRLAYLVWRSMPDAELSAAADAGELRTPGQIAAQATRLMADPRARAAWWTFFAQWLHIDEVEALHREPAMYPGFGDGARRFMQESARAFVEAAAWDAGDLRQLYDGPFRHPDDPEHLGDRRGVLAQPAVLAVTSTPVMTNPVYRGVFVREQILCAPLAPPPADLAVVAPDPDPNLTTREQFAEHSDNPTCAGCHVLIDPLGFGFEHYDAIGNRREVQNGHPVDAAGEIVSTWDIDGEFYDLDALAAALARSEQVHRCVATQLFRYAYGRGEGEGDGCTLHRLYDRYVDAGYDFEAMIVALVTDPSFALRRGVTP